MPETHSLISAVHGVRYQVKDVARAVAFYTQRLGFTLKHQQLPAFANVSLGGADILLSGPGASGSGRCRMVSVRHQVGGTAWCSEWPTSPPASPPSRAGVTFRNEMEEVRVAGRSRSKIRTGIRSNCSSRRLGLRPEFLLCSLSCADLVATHTNEHGGYANKCRSELCRNCVRSPRKRRQTPTFTGSHQDAFCGGKSLNRLRKEMFPCSSMSSPKSSSKRAHSTTLTSLRLESTIYGRSRTV